MLVFKWFSRSIAALLVTVATAPAMAGDIPASFRSESSGEVPAGIKVPGTVQRTVRWTDAKGDHLAVFSTEEKVVQKKDMPFTTRGLHVTVFTSKNGKFKKGRTIREIVPNCPFDNTNEFRETSVGVTDIDKNNIGELTFAYAHGCRSDVSPLGFKLLMLEGTKKYALRGTTRVNPGDGLVGGEFTPDFKKAPAGFAEHAEKVWKKHVNE